MSLITGDDHLDDPAWGSPVIWEGTLRELPAFLRAQGSLDELSVVIDERDCLWARDFLAQRC